MRLEKVFKFIINKMLLRANIYTNKIGIGTKIHKSVTVCERSSIGSYTYLSKNVSIAYTSIGSFCSIGSNVQIGAGHHNLENISTSMRINNCLSPYNLVIKQTVLEDDVWIGTNVTILQGCKIGQGAVVGANTLVNKDIPPYYIVGGVPGKFIRPRFEHVKIGKLLKADLYSGSFKEVLIKIEKFI
jgi:acetyltransferase-like isoleucine patch superfamily enzyme